MKSRKKVLMNLYCKGGKGEAATEKRLVDTVREGEGGRN